MILVTPAIVLREEELEFQYKLASGPGGQHVNKVESAVELRFDTARSPSLTEELRARLLALAGRRGTKEGVVVITARRYRSRERNREEAIQRLVALIRRAAEPPRPRKPTRPSRSARRRRLEDKRRAGARKQARRPVDPQRD